MSTKTEDPVVSDFKKLHTELAINSLKPNHVLHLLITVFTLGLWLLPWIAISGDQCVKRNKIRAENGMQQETNIGVYLFIAVAFIGVIKLISNQIDSQNATQMQAALNTCRQQAQTEVSRPGFKKPEHVSVYQYTDLPDIPGDKTETGYTFDWLYPQSHCEVSNGKVTKLILNGRFFKG